MTNPMSDERLRFHERRSYGSIAAQGVQYFRDEIICEIRRLKKEQRNWEDGWIEVGEIRALLNEYFVLVECGEATERIDSFRKLREWYDKNKP